MMNKLLTAGFVLFLALIFGCYYASPTTSAAFMGQSIFQFADGMRLQLMMLTAITLGFLLQKDLK